MRPASYEKHPQEEADVIDTIDDETNKQDPSPVDVTICLVHPQGVKENQDCQHESLDDRRQPKKDVLTFACQSRVGHAFSTRTLVGAQPCVVLKIARCTIVVSTKTDVPLAAFRVVKQYCEVNTYA